MRHFCGAKKLGPDYTFIHCLRVYLLLVSPVKATFSHPHDKISLLISDKTEEIKDKVKDRENVEDGEKVVDGEKVKDGEKAEGDSDEKNKEAKSEPTKGDEEGNSY